VNDTAEPLTNRRAMLLSAVANGLAFIAQLAVAFFLAPPMLRYFGRERYGAWSFVESILAYFTLFDLGITATLVRYVPKCRAENDTGLLNRVVSGCLLVFSGAGLVVVLLGSGIFSLILQFTSKVPADMHDEAWGMTIISLAALGLVLPLSIFTAILDGLGRFTLKSGLRTLFLCGRVAGVLAVLAFGGSLVSLALVFAVTTVGEQLAMAVAVRRLLPNVKPAPWRTDREALRLIRGYSFDSFLALIAGRISFKTDAIVIGLCGSMGLIPFFDMPSRLVEYAKNLIRSATTTLTPAFSALDAQGGKSAIRELFLTGSRCALYMALPIQLGLLMFGGAFLELWLKDPEYRVKGQPILWILAGTLGVGMLQSMAARVLYGVGQIRRFARLLLLEAGLNLGLSLALFPVLGINGVALGTAIPNIAMCLYIVLYVCVMLEIDDRRLFRQALLKPLVAMAFLGAFWWGLLDAMPPTSWRGLLILGGSGVAAYAALVLGLEYISSRHFSLASKRSAAR
jgi:O-antigen/teichoic acid export membrane protein